MKQINILINQFDQPQGPMHFRQADAYKILITQKVSSLK